ncbi:hypothetical protein FA15DRAFT_573291, partial [Coprinopsis marcescibilis]
DVLDKLEELSIINIDDEQDDSPSYDTASLPTPEAPLADFNLRTVSPYQHPLYIWYDIDDNDNQVSGESLSMKVPGAPLMRDLDSFTEGTGTGSFDDIPCAATNEVGESIYSTTEATVSLLPPPEPFLAAIERWRENVNVLEDTFLPVKRRRSPSPEDERCVRRIRPRIRALSLPPNFRSFTQCIGFSTTRSEPDAPD